MLVATIGAFRLVGHSLRRAYELESAFIYEADVQYERIDGRKVSVPYVNLLTFGGVLVDTYPIDRYLSGMRS